MSSWAAFSFNSRLREEATSRWCYPTISCSRFNSRLREEATLRFDGTEDYELFQLTPP